MKRPAEPMHITMQTAAEYHRGEPLIPGNPPAEDAQGTRVIIRQGITSSGQPTVCFALPMPEPLVVSNPLQAVPRQVRDFHLVAEFTARQLRDLLRIVDHVEADPQAFPFIPARQTSAHLPPAEATKPAHTITCQACGYKLDAHRMGKDGKLITPNAGDVSICFNCGHAARIDQDGKPSQPVTPEFLVELNDIAPDAFDFFHRSRTEILRRGRLYSDQEIKKMNEG